MIKFNNKTVKKIYAGDEQVNRLKNDTDTIFRYIKVGEPTPVPYEEQCFAFVAEDDNMSVGLTYAGSNVYQYSVDNGTTWSSLTNNQSTSSVNTGGKILFKASGLTPNGSDGIGTLAPSANASLQGNIMSLLYGDNFSGQTTITNQDQFRGLFYQCTHIISAEHLILPATTLANNCYQSMFWGCSYLTTAPELPATTLASGCYQYMFYQCYSLNYIKCLATNISAIYCTNQWVSDVASTGTFIKAASMNIWKTGENGIPSGWTVQNDDGSPVVSLKYTATYTNGDVVTASCNDSGSVLVRNEISKTNLKTVVLSECVTRISGECFSDCSNLTGVTIEGNTTIDAYSFARNNGTLKTIRMNATTPPQCDGAAFTYYKSGSGYVPMESIRIYVPSASVSAYKAASGWSRYANKIYGL